MFRGARTWTGSLPCLFLTILIVTLAVPRQGFTQVLYGSILGDIKDSSGALGPWSHRRRHQQEHWFVTRGSSATRAVDFTFGDLPAGVYIFKVTQQGFKAFEQTSVTVTINNITPS